MKKTLLGVLVILLAFGVNAQLTVNPGTSTGTGPATSIDIGAYAQVTNTSSDTIELLWSRTVVSMEHGWTTWVCDLNNCYLPTTESCPTNRPNFIAPGSSLNFEVHVGPAGIEGNASVQIQFYTVDDPSTIIGTLFTQFETTTSSVSDPGNEVLRIFPNPTTSYFQISDPTSVSEVAIYSMVGNKMRVFNASQGNRYEVSDLPVGVYLVRLLDNNQKVLKTVRLSKR